MILFLFFMLPLASFSSPTEYAHIYTDTLLEQFDKELEGNADFLLETSPSYKRLIAARIFLEQREALNARSSISSLLEVTNTQAYMEMLTQIETINFNLSGQWQSFSGREFPANTWSLTFDDGPRRGRTESIVDDLYRRGIKASFFMVTKQLESQLATGEYVRDSGMEVAFHSYTHKNLNSQVNKVLDYEITEGKEKLEKQLKIEVSNFRLPYGSGLSNQRVQRYVVANKMRHFFWNVDSLDWKDRDPQSVFERVKKQMARAKGGIILFHDIQAPTVKTAPMVMDYLIQEQKNICTIQAVMSHLEGEKVSCIP